MERVVRIMGELAERERSAQRERASSPSPTIRKVVLDKRKPSALLSDGRMGIMDEFFNFFRQEAQSRSIVG